MMMFFQSIVLFADLSRDFGINYLRRTQIGAELISSVADGFWAAARHRRARPVTRHPWDLWTKMRLIASSMRLAHLLHRHVDHLANKRDWPAIRCVSFPWWRVTACIWFTC